MSVPQALCATCARGPHPHASDSERHCSSSCDLAESSPRSLRDLSLRSCNHLHRHTSSTLVRAPSSYMKRLLRFRKLSVALCNVAAPSHSRGASNPLAVEYDPGNPFLRILRGEASAYKLLETEHALAFLDTMPLTRGHCLLIPKASCSSRRLSRAPQTMHSILRSLRLRREEVVGHVRGPRMTSGVEPRRRSLDILGRVLPGSAHLTALHGRTAVTPFLSLPLYLLQCPPSVGKRWCARCLTRTPRHLALHRETAASQDLPTQHGRCWKAFCAIVPDWTCAWPAHAARQRATRPEPGRKMNGVCPQIGYGHGI